MNYALSIAQLNYDRQEPPYVNETLAQEKARESAFVEFNDEYVERFIERIKSQSPSYFEVFVWQELDFSCSYEVERFIYSTAKIWVSNRESLPESISGEFWNFAKNMAKRYYDDYENKEE